MSKITISIVIPTFNMATFLEQLLNCIDRENYPNLQVIIIDGGSTDSTRHVVNQYAHLVSIYISEADRGQAHAVNKGLALANGEILHWHAADDLIIPGSLSLVGEIFAQDAHLDLIYSDGLAYVDGAIVYTGKCRGLSRKIALSHFGRFQSDCAYWRRNAGLGVTLDESMPLCVDEDFFLQIWWRSRKYSWIKQPLGLFRQHGAQVSQRADKSNLARDRKLTRQKVYRQLGWTTNYVRILKLSTAPVYAFYRWVASPYYDLLRKFIYPLHGCDYKNQAKKALGHFFSFRQSQTHGS